MSVLVATSSSSRCLLIDIADLSQPIGQLLLQFPVFIEVYRRFTAGRAVNWIRLPVAEIGPFGRLEAQPLI